MIGFHRHMFTAWVEWSIREDITCVSLRRIIAAA